MTSVRLLRHVPSIVVGLGLAAGGCGRLLEFAVGCASNADCTDGKVCIDGACVPCTDGSQCDAGRACVNGACGACTSTAQCPARLACIDGVCAPCTRTSQCTPGDACVNSTCGDCSDSSQCEAPDACIVALGRCQSCDADLQRDADNCGRCGNVCPVPVNASRRCSAGVCGRGPCAAGTFDFDGDVTFGCEATCVGRSCELGDGTDVDLDSPPVHETAAAAALASGGSFGSVLQTSSTHTNVGLLGQSTPGSADSTAEQSSAAHRHVGGFTSTLTQP